MYHIQQCGTSYPFCERDLRELCASFLSLCRVAHLEQFNLVNTHDWRAIVFVHAKAKHTFFNELNKYM